VEVRRHEGRIVGRGDLGLYIAMAVKSVMHHPVYFLIFYRKYTGVHDHDFTVRVILKQTPPYNLYGVFPFQPFSIETAE
jgi:hypothetical protein